MFWETGVCGLGWSVPAPPRALTLALALALTRRAGEGTVVVFWGCCSEGVGRLNYDANDWKGCE